MGSMRSIYLLPLRYVLAELRRPRVGQPELHLCAVGDLIGHQPRSAQQRIGVVHARALSLV